MSRSLIIGLIITIAITIGLTSFFYTNYIKVKNTSAIDAVPNDAAIILEIKNIQQNWASFYETDIWKDLRQNESLSFYNSFFLTSDSLLSTNENLQHILADNKTTISFHCNKGNKLALLFIAEIGSYASQDELLNWIAKSANGTIVKRFFDKEVIYEIKDAEQQNLFTLATYNQLLMLSADGTLVEESIRKMKYRAVHQSNGFAQAKSIAEVSSSLNVYINYKEFPIFLSLFAKDEYKTAFSYLQSFANWSVLNIEIEQNQLNISGVTFTDDSMFQFLDLFKTQTPVNFDLSAILPSSTAYYQQFNFSNYLQFNSDLNEYHQKMDKLEVYTSYVDSIESKYNISITERLKSQIGPTALVGIHEGSGLDQQVFGIIQFNNNTEVLEIFESYTQSIDKRGELDSSSFEYNGKQIKHLPLGNVFKLFYGKAFEKLNSPYYFSFDKYIIMANSAATLTQILDEINGGQTLANNVSFTEYHKAAASSNVNFFMCPGNSFQLPLIYANELFISALNRNSFDVKKFEFLEIQFANSSNSTFFTNVSIKFNPSFKEETKVLWMAKLDTTFTMQPILVYNSELKQTSIIVQDVMNTIYFINNAGQILWRSKLSAKINSQLFEVHPTQTEEVYYLFSTTKQVFMLSNKGVNMNGYPVYFPGVATAGINLFDFYGDSSFQYFVPLESKKMMGYSLNGKPIQGWNPKNIQSKITTKLGGFVLGSNAYVCGTMASNQLAIFGLNSNLIEPIATISASANYPAYVFSSDLMNATIWITDTTGNFMKIEVDSSFTLAQSQIIKANIKDSYHLVKQLTSGFLLLSASSTGFDLEQSDGRKLMSKKFTDSLTTLPFYTETHIQIPMIGYTETTFGKVNLIDFKGIQYPSLPISGNTPFAIGDVLSNKSNYLICGDKLNNILMYRLK